MDGWNAASSHVDYVPVPTLYSRLTLARGKFTVGVRELKAFNNSQHRFDLLQVFQSNESMALDSPPVFGILLIPFSSIEEDGDRVFLPLVALFVPFSTNKKHHAIIGVAIGPNDSPHTIGIERRCVQNTEAATFIAGTFIEERRLAFLVSLIGLLERQYRFLFTMGLWMIGDGDCRKACGFV